MQASQRGKPRVVSREEWLGARRGLLEREKAATRAMDELSAARRRLPMVRVEKAYEFEGEGGRAGLADLFEGRRQLILYHFMLDPAWEEGCSGCSFFVDNLPHLAHLHARDTSVALVSLGPLAKLAAFKRRMGWGVPWYSSLGSDFNRDFGVTTDRGETFGLSVFLREGGEVHHTYFTDGRGVENLGSVWGLLDVTPYGRQETWEDSPEGWPRTPPYTWWRHHDRYGARGGKGAKA